jgi:hypothetical protein
MNGQISWTRQEWIISVLLVSTIADFACGFDKYSAIMENQVLELY